MKNKQFFLLFLFVLLFLSKSSPANASILDDIGRRFKNLFSSQQPQPTQQTGPLTVSSNISLANGGDVNKNGQIDAGDIVTFTYAIENQTDKEYPFATLNTKIQRDRLHFIHDIRGTASLSDKNKTITIPNLRINPYQKIEISFNARVNYFSDADAAISTEPEFVSQDAKTKVSSVRKEIKARKINRGDIPSLMKIKEKEK